jgi:hypothetical protein
LPGPQVGIGWPCRLCAGRLHTVRFN